MTTADHSSATASGRPAEPCALLWDGSFLWGIMACKALKAAGLPYCLVTAAEVRQGVLNRFRMLFVPGGWAVHKEEALGEAGMGEIRRFVSAGGSYLGICGGAGLATGKGLGLLPVSRKPTAERVASFSGPIRVETTPHPLWQGIARPVFLAWWPSQLAIDTPGVRTLATYGEAEPSALSADIPVAEGNLAGWSGLEARYGILLDPARLQGEPAVVVGHCGRGRVILSLLHFDTPGDDSGRLVLANLWQYLAGTGPSAFTAAAAGASARPQRDLPPDLLALLAEVRRFVDDLIACGEALALWRWRNPFLLQWRRGVRGLEYSTLAVLLREIEARLLTGPCGSERAAAPGAEALQRWQRELLGIRGLLAPFCSQAKALLAQEARCLGRGSLSPLVCDDPALQEVRRELFGSAMRHGGAFRPLLAALDSLWLALVRTDTDPGLAGVQSGCPAGQAGVDSSNS